MTNIIGISGKSKSGKDTVGKIIQYLIAENEAEFVPLDYTIHEFLEGKDVYYINRVKNYENSISQDSGWEIKRYGDKLKQIISLLTGCKVKDLENQDFKESFLPKQWGDITYRDALKMVGGDDSSGLRKELHPNCWVYTLWNDYRENTKVLPSKWIITDVRFPNEIEPIELLGGLKIRVNRNTKNNSPHLSETGLDDYLGFDYIIDNNGTIDELIEKVKVILKKEGII